MEARVSLFFGGVIAVLGRIGVCESESDKAWMEITDPQFFPLCLWVNWKDRCEEDDQYCFEKRR